MTRHPSVLLVADLAMTWTDALASLRGTADVRGPNAEGVADGVDVIVVEQTMAAPSEERLARLADGAPGAPILTVIAEGCGRYSWLRVRRAGVLYQIEASGAGSLADAVLDAAVPRRPKRRLIPRPPARAPAPRRSARAGPRPGSAACPRCWPRGDARCAC